MPPSFPEPKSTTADPARLFLEYLDFYRATIADKLDGLADVELRHSRLPSGWTPIELLKHLVYMERRWLVWGFEGETVDAPWGDRGPNDRWQVGDDESVEELVAALHRGGARTRATVESADLASQGEDTGRFGGGVEPPNLIWILFHVLQEYARHAGHLDIVRELVDGTVGE